VLFLAPGTVAPTCCAKSWKKRSRYPSVVGITALPKFTGVVGWGTMDGYFRCKASRSSTFRSGYAAAISGSCESRASTTDGGAPYGVASRVRPILLARDRSSIAFSPRLVARRWRSLRRMASRSFVDRPALSVFS
jgi:hypothetical protein